MNMLRSSFAPIIAQRTQHLFFSRVLITSAYMACLFSEASLASKPMPPDPKKFYPIVADAAIDVLPPALGERFRPYFQVVSREAAEHDPGFMMKERRENYMVWLDFSAPENSSRDARLEAARAFPLSRELAKQAGYREEQFGDLSFQLLEHYQALVEAFRASQWKDVREQCIWVLHYATAAALPSQTTREKRDGSPHRLELWLAERIRARLEIEVRVFPGRFERLPDARQEILGKLRETHLSYFAFQDIEQQARRETGIGDGGSPYSSGFDASPMEREFRRIFSERAGDVLCRQFKNSALLAANLIGTAWMDAGSPEVPMDTFAPRAEEKPGDTAKQGGADKSGIAAGDQKKGAAAGALDLVADKFMGSSGSETYHRSSCQHAARIKPENTIRFTSLEEAQRAGRKACQTCKPDAK